MRVFLYIIILLVVVSGLWSGSIEGQKQSKEEKVGLREQCRKVVAAEYINVFDKKQIATAYMVTLEEKLKHLNKSISQQQKLLADTNAKYKDKEYNVEYSRERDRAQNALDTLNSQKTETIDLQKKAKDSFAESQLKVKELETNISKIFNIVKTEEKKDGGYPIDLKYKSTCPKFRYICTLSKVEARDLLVLSNKDKSLYESCIRYANYSGVE